MNSYLFKKQIPNLIWRFPFTFFCSLRMECFLSSHAFVFCFSSLLFHSFFLLFNEKPPAERLMIMRHRKKWRNPKAVLFNLHGVDIQFWISLKNKLRKIKIFLSSKRFIGHLNAANILFVLFKIRSIYYVLFTKIWSKEWVKLWWLKD